MTEHQITEAAAIIEASVAGKLPYGIESKTAYAALLHVLPEGYRADVTDLERFAPNPRRSTGIVRPGTVDDLANYLERFGDDRTTVWVHPHSGRVESVLNDHALTPVDGDIALTALPGHGDHRAILDLIPTPEWETWNDKDGYSFNQVDFAEHIEANGREIVEPAAADLLEIAQSFHASSAATFRTAKRLQDGRTQFQYDETVNATAGKSGELVVPATFQLAIRPFVGEPAYAVTARLRYRVGGGNLTLTYKLDRPQDVVRDALQGVGKRLADRFDNVYVGTPRS